MDMDVQDRRGKTRSDEGRQRTGAGSRRSRRRELSSAIESAAAGAAAQQHRTSHRLPETCSIREAAALKSELLALLSASGPITLDGEAVARVDTAGIQVIAAFLRSCHRDERTVTWGRVSAEVTRAAETLDLCDALGLSRRDG